MRPVLILSGDREQTEALARELQLSISEYRHVFDVDDLYCNRGVMMIWGDWRGRKDLDLIREVAHKRCLTMLYVDGSPRP